MSRTIKFRAWEKTAHHMINNIVVTNTGTVMFGLPNREYEIMQFTGLFDKSGKEIWEGDIVHCTLRATGQEIYVVEWIEVTAEFSIQNKGICEKYLEVIGNIYENLDLLEGKE